MQFCRRIALIYHLLNKFAEVSSQKVLRVN